MKYSTRQKLLGSFTLLLFLLACVLPSAVSQTQEGPPQDLEMLGTMIAGTAAFAQTETEAALPPSATPSPTREATSTFIVAPFTQTPFLLPTATSEFGVVIETTDPLYAATATGAAIADANDTNPDHVAYTGKPWTCGIRSTIPRGDVIQAGSDFYAYWTIVNTGTHVWTSNTVDFVFVSGYLQGGRKIQDLPSTIGSGGFITLKVLYKAPKAPGTYRSIWTLKVGNQPFCGLAMHFEVKD